MLEPQDFYIKLEKECKKKKINQKQLAEKLGISTRTIQKSREENRLPNLNIAMKICEELEVSLDYMFLDLDNSIENCAIYNEMRVLFSRKNAEKLAFTELFMDFLENYNDN